MRIKQTLHLFLLITITGCVTQRLDKVPDDFILHVDSSAIMTTLAALDEDEALTIVYDPGKSDLSKKNLKQLDDFIKVTAPRMVVLRGTAGKDTDTYRTLGQQRALNLAQYFHDLGIDSLILDYDPTSRGKRALIWTLNPTLEQQTRRDAAALMIYARRAAYHDQ